jgi:hypothetical protein
MENCYSVKHSEFESLEDEREKFEKRRVEMGKKASDIMVKNDKMSSATQKLMNENIKMEKFIEDNKSKKIDIVNILIIVFRI